MCSTHLIQMTTSSVSLLSSLLLLIVIKPPSGKFASPHDRIISALSLSDVMRSIALLTGPFSPPKGTPYAQWAMGSIHTCKFNGFLLVFGSQAVAYYLAFLCLYYYFKLNRNMNDGSFRDTVEKKVHLVIGFLTLGLCVPPLLLDLYNPLPKGGMCYFACSNYTDFDSGECTQEKDYLTFQHLAHNLVLGSMLVGLVLVFLLYVFVLRIEKKYRLKFSSSTHRRPSHVSSLSEDEKEDENENENGTSDYDTTNNNNNSHSRTKTLPQNAFILSCCSWWNCDVYEQKGSNETDNDYTQRRQRRETVIQALLYVTAFIITHASIGLYLLLQPSPRLDNNDHLQTIFMQGIYPLFGFLNILIYTRPQVVKFQMLYPEHNWVHSFCLVVKSGGEVPHAEHDESVLRLCPCFECCHSNGYHDGISDLSYSSEKQGHSKKRGRFKKRSFPSTVGNGNGEGNAGLDGSGNVTDISSSLRLLLTNTFGRKKESNRTDSNNDRSCNSSNKSSSKKISNDNNNNNNSNHYYDEEEKTEEKRETVTLKGIVMR